jgi:hypothetical protein
MVVLVLIAHQVWQVVEVEPEDLGHKELVAVL